jgi:hypothetical protein
MSFIVGSFDSEQFRAADERKSNWYPRDLEQPSHQQAHSNYCQRGKYEIRARAYLFHGLLVGMSSCTPAALIA